MTARIYKLGEEPGDDISATTTAGERLEMVAVLTRRTWEITGRPWPNVPRGEWPVTIRSLGD